MAQAKDPRLIEIEILGDLEGIPKPKSVQRDKPSYDLDENQFTEILYDFLLNGFINKTATISSRKGDPTINPNFWRGDLEKNRVLEDVASLLRGSPLEIQISHSGRLQLWRLRDEMLSNAEKEDFGILFNKRTWLRHWPVKLGLASEEQPLSLMMLDLDRFKRVNDEYGHPVGDAVLKLAFSLIRDHFIGEGDAYRYGGEEVATLLPGMSFDEARKRGEEIRMTIETTIAKELDEISSQTVSIGISTFSKPQDPQQAFKFVDDLLYKAKTTGRNKVVAELPTTGHHAP